MYNKNNIKYINILTYLKNVEKKNTCQVLIE